MFPTAMGLIPPFGFEKANKFAPKKNGRKSSGTPPDRIKLEKSLRDCRRAAPASPKSVEVSSFKICGRSPAGPAADPAGKNSIAFVISPGVVEI